MNAIKLQKVLTSEFRLDTACAVPFINFLQLQINYGELSVQRNDFHAYNHNRYIVEAPICEQSTIIITKFLIQSKYGAINRIVGGEEAGWGEIPWFARVEGEIEILPGTHAGITGASGDPLLCAASIISSTALISVAYCLYHDDLKIW